MIVLDTNVLSELMLPMPDPAVFGWAESQPRRLLCTTSINQAEILAGVAQMPAGGKRARLAERVESFFIEHMAGRIIGFQGAAAAHYAAIAAARRFAGLPISSMDALIAAVTLAAGADIATRDTAGFSHIAGLRVIDPWIEGA